MEDRQAAEGERRWWPALDHRPYLCDRSGAWRHARDHASSRSFPRKTLTFNFNLPGKEFPQGGPAGGGISRRIRPLLQARPRLDADRVQARDRDRSEAVSRHQRSPFGSVDPNEPEARVRPTDSRRKRTHPARLRPWKNGSNMDMNELQVGSDAIPAGVSQGWLDLDGRFPLPAG